MTRTVADAAMLMTILAKPDRRDFMSLPHDGIDYAARLGRDLAGLKIGLLSEIGAGIAPMPEVRAAVGAAARTLAAAGAVVTEVPPFLDAAMLDGLDRFFRARSFTDMQRMTPEQRR